MKCLTCQGRGFIELNHGLIQRRCTSCNGSGEVEDALSPFKKEQDYGDIDLGHEPDQPARKRYTRKSTKPRKRAKGA